MREMNGEIFFNILKKLFSHVFKKDGNRKKINTRRKRELREKNHSVKKIKRKKNKKWKKGLV